jgi:hypothetical protein
MGLAWMLDPVGGVRKVWHGGATNGQIAMLSLAPERDFAVAVLTNANVGGALVTELTQEAFHALLGVRAAPPAALRLSPRELAAYAGRYDAQLATRTLRVEGRRLVMRTQTKGGFPTQDSPPLPPPPPTQLSFVAPDVVTVPGSSSAMPRGEFLRDGKGRIAWFRFAGRLHASRRRKRR